MGKIQAEIKTSFGRIIIEGSTPDDLIEALKCIPENLISDLEDLISRIIKSRGAAADEFSEVVKYTEDGPVLMLRDPKSITYYEAIGLLLYFSEGKRGKPSQLRRLLEYSGINAQVSSRLNEMLRRGLVIKPDPRRSLWALTPKGECWIKEEVLPKLRKMH